MSVTRQGTMEKMAGDPGVCLQFLDEHGIKDCFAIFNVELMRFGNPDTGNPVSNTQRAI